LVRSETGTWLPAWVPQSSFWLSFLLIICCIVQAAVCNIEKKQKTLEESQQSGD
jgi:hypothetical protein